MGGTVHHACWPLEPSSCHLSAPPPLAPPPTLPPCPTPLHALPSCSLWPHRPSPSHLSPLSHHHLPASVELTLPQAAMMRQHVYLQGRREEEGVGGRGTGQGQGQGQVTVVEMELVIVPIHACLALMPVSLPYAITPDFTTLIPFPLSLLTSLPLYSPPPPFFWGTLPHLSSRHSHACTPALPAHAHASHALLPPFASPSSYIPIYTLICQTCLPYEDSSHCLCPGWWMVDGWVVLLGGLTSKLPCTCTHHASA